MKKGLSQAQLEDIRSYLDDNMTYM